MKKLTIRNFAAIKRTAQNVNPLVVKKSKLLAQAKKMLEEASGIEEEIKGYEAGTMALTGGYQSEDLVKKVVEDTGKLDKAGSPVKVTRYIPTDIVSFNAEENCYYVPDYVEKEDIQVPSETEHGSDFDLDKETFDI